jgi:hypothetical protein
VDIRWKLSLLVESMKRDLGDGVHDLERDQASRNLGGNGRLGWFSCWGLKVQKVCHAPLHTPRVGVHN